MNIIRYVNGKKIEEQDLKNYIIENEIILNTIKAVNDRIKKISPKDNRIKK